MRQFGLLIVEDDQLFASVLRLFLEGEESLSVVDTVATADEAFDHPSLGAVDVVLIDIGLPGIDGIAATKRLLELQPRLRIVVMSGSGFNVPAENAIAAGASAYLEKGALHETLVTTLLSAARANSVRPAA
jgi:DNA-binding NarL/FixJ family response regulator